MATAATPVGAVHKLMLAYLHTKGQGQRLGQALANMADEIESTTGIDPFYISDTRLEAALKQLLKG